MSEEGGTAAEQKDPIQIDDNIWWVGHFLQDDPFQCHCYLIENGRDSILIDPGSRLTFPKTFSKIEKILPFSHIKYFIVHHQDPDIVGALDVIDQINSRDDALILSHWRAIALLKHLDLKMPFQCVEKMDWSLRAGQRELQFIFTPYLHFPGAFCTYDKQSKSLFSSDICGGFTKGFSLFARDESYWESMKSFHEHYMPSKEILAFAVRKFEQLPLKYILPQHGSIIREDLIPYIMDQLKNLDCGLYLLTQTSTEIEKLSKLNSFMKDFMQTLVFNRLFDTAVRELLDHIKTIIPQADDLKFIIFSEKDSWKLLEKKFHFKGKSYQLDKKVKKRIQNIRDQFAIIPIEDQWTIILPLKHSTTKRTFAYTLIALSENVSLDLETQSIFGYIIDPLCIVLEREIIQQQLDSEKQQFYELSIKDNLTDLYNRTYMNETLPRLLSHHDRGMYNGIALLMLDLDHFKIVNDTYGHSTGDIVLKKTARTIQDSLREGDMAVRIGGEEFAVFLILKDPEKALEIAERIRMEIQSIDFSDYMDGKKQTISGGIVMRKKGESLEELISRADNCLYQAKKNGRNTIVSVHD